MTAKVMAAGRKARPFLLNRPAAKAWGGAMPENGLDAQKAWEMTRQLIQAQDSIINQRLTWLLVINGFLLAALGGVVSAFEKASDNWYKLLLWVCTVAIAILASAICELGHNLLDVPLVHLWRIGAWWGRYCRQRQIDRKDYPPISGWKKKFNEKRMYNIRFMPLCLLWFWLAVGCILALLFLYYVLAYVPGVWKVLGLLPGVALVILLVKWLLLRPPWKRLPKGSPLSVGGAASGGGAGRRGGT